MDDIKIFFNDIVLIITNSSFNSNCKDNIFFSISNNNDLIKIVNFIKKINKKCTVTAYTEHFDDTWNFFTNFFERISAAGGLVFNQFDELLVIERLDKWDLPKGKVEEDETFSQAALREVEEECGIHDLSIEKFLGLTYHVYDLGDKSILKTTYWFKMNALKQVLIPQTSENIKNAFWLKKTDIELLKEKTFPSLKDFIENFFYNQI